ncbi:MAG: bifunctional phosphoribosylaminoimidazolecarboxamide formyltransferase/inosine monophosphate [Pseudomonadota bacterium]|jgi:phosphoribosylaminoimidazolecarboxamide formyltransferase/IMP cyclohydrolase
MKKCALLSVSDRSGLPELAAALHKAGYTLLATSGTGKALDEGKVPWTSVESYTGLAELLDGRVKTLHPKIHGGILARRDQPHHLKQMEEAEIGPIDLVIVNLYPFLKYVQSEKASKPEEMTELIDVGGPTMIRAAAKNHAFVLPLIDPADYPEVIAALSQRTSGDPFSLEMRRRLASKVFATLSQYDGAIARYFGDLVSAGSATSESAGLPSECTVTLSKVSDLRYGENPHQRAALYRPNSDALTLFSGPRWEQLGGKELSYNNMLDLDAGIRLLSDLPSERTTVAILKHLNPCGVAVGKSVVEAIERAKECDPRSHFGGVLVCNRPVDRAAAEEIRGDFAELVLAPDFVEGALDVLRTSKNLRILKVDVSTLKGFDARTVAGGVLVQEPDIDRSRIAHAALSSSRTPSDEELADLELAWRIVGHVKSNAIVLVRDGLLVGVGAGQMSRIDSVELAIRKAKLHGHLLNGAVAASDAFFPFPDSVETLAAEGVTCVVAPAGARRDDDVKETANANNLSLFFASDRHFRH